MSLTQIAQADVQNLLNQTGETVILGGQHRLNADIIRNAEESPSYGYDNHISGKKHELIFAYLDCLNKVWPVRGMSARFDETDHEILYVVPSDYIRVRVFTS